jgi:hypothetical protein
MLDCFENNPSEKQHDSELSGMKYTLPYVDDIFEYHLAQNMQKKSNKTALYRLSIIFSHLGYPKRKA